MPTPFWFALLDAHCREKSGLTIPFLVGASAIQSGTSVRPENANFIMSQMKEIRFSNSMFFVALCTHLQAPVITLVHDYGEGIKFNLGPEWGSDDQERMKRVLLDAEEPIRSGNFSRIREGSIRSWRPFCEDELNQIRRVIKSYDSEA